jgi:hypothetical protein
MLETLGLIVAFLGVALFGVLMLGTFIVAIYSMVKGFGWVLVAIRNGFAKPKAKSGQQD